MILVSGLRWKLRLLVKILGLHLLVGCGINAWENQEGRLFHLIMDDDDAMFMTDLVRGHGEVHVYVGHPVHDSILINGSEGQPMDLVVEPEDTKPLVVSEPEGYYSSEPAYDGYYNVQGYFCSDGDDYDGVGGGNDWDCNQNFMMVAVTVVVIGMVIRTFMIAVVMVVMIGMAIIVVLVIVIMMLMILLLLMFMITLLIQMLQKYIAGDRI